MDVSALIPGFPQNLFIQSCTIASGASVSERIATQGLALVGIITPTSGWTAANIGYKSCWTGRDADLVPVYNSGGTLEQAIVSTDAAAASIWILFPVPDALFSPWIQLTSVVAATPQVTTAAPQAADRVLYLLFRRFLS